MLKPKGSTLMHSYVCDLPHWYMQGILGVTADQVVSTDFIHDKRSSVVDVGAGISLNSKFVKVCSRAAVVSFSLSV